jgi:hypothetical protein
LVISFKFSVFDLEIEHKILKELGEFTIFCMKAINSNIKIKDISNIIQIKESVIEKQLSFAISRKYLTNDFVLTDKGTETVKLFEFLNMFNQKKIKIALEHYIENDSKLLYSVSNKKFDNNSIGYLIKDNLFDYKIQNKFDEIIEKDRSKIKDFILDVDGFSNYTITIEKYLNDFIFKINKNEKQKFYNYEINEDSFISELNNTRDKNNSYISIDIPILEVEKIITSDILGSEYIDRIKAEFDKYKYFNLINGQPIKLGNQKKNSNIKIEPLISNKSIIESNLNNQYFQINNLLYVDMKTEIKEFYQTKFFDITKIMDNI